MEIQIPNRNNFSICADDFGISERANRNIFHLLDLGKIDRIAIIIDGIINAKDIDKLLRSGCKLDIHLTMGPTGKESNGIFWRSLKFLLNYSFNGGSARNMEKKWDDQIKKFKKLFGKYPDGVNSHEHIHFFPPYFKKVLALSAKFEIPYIRFGNHRPPKFKSLISKILNFLHAINSPSFSKSIAVSSERMISLDWIMLKENEILTHPGEGVTEIVCHPERAEEFVFIRKIF